MKGYWHFPAIAVAISIVTVIFQTNWIIACFLFWLFCLYCFKRIGKIPIIISLGFFFFFYIYIPDIAPSQQNSSINSQLATLSGQIVGSVHRTPQKIDFIIKDVTTKQKLLAVYFISENSPLMDNNKSKLVHGATCQLTGRLELPEQSRNPGQFDYQYFLRSKGITYQLIIDDMKNISCSGSSWLASIYELRSRMLASINDNVSNETAAWISALVLGDDENLNEQTVQLFQRWGLSHILAISGLHVGLVVAFLYFMLIKWNILTKEKAQWMMIFFLPLYAILAGGEPSIWRACLMVLLFIILRKLKLRFSITDGLSLVFILLILADKYIVYSVGFQFSFLVTFGLLLSKQWFAESRSHTFLVLKISFVSQMIILPLQVAYFFTFHPLSILLNVLVVPYFSLFVIPLMFILCIVSPFAKTITDIMDSLFVKVNDFVILLIQTIDNGFYYPFAIGSFTLIGAALYYALFFLFMKHLEQKIRWRAFVYGCFIACFIIGLAIRPYFSPVGTVTMLDIGQGDAFIIELPFRDGVIMIDAGSRVRFGEDEYSSGIYKTVIKPFLLSRGITSLDIIFLTHEDKDHIGSVPFIVNDMDVDKVIVSRFFQLSNPLAHQLMKTGTEIITVKSDTSIKIGEHSFHVLSPMEKKTTPNANSLVIYTKIGGLSWLFTGDIDKEVERELLNTYPGLMAEVLKVAHHGSDTSTELSFLKQINPQFALISVGKHNTYGHPSKEVLDKLQGEQTVIFRTDQNGAVSYHFKGKQGTFSSFLP